MDPSALRDLLEKTYEATDSYSWRRLILIADLDVSVFALLLSLGTGTKRWPVGTDLRPRRFPVCCHRTFIGDTFGNVQDFIRIDDCSICAGQKYL